jgi:2'-5' RNA ligase
MRLFIGIPLAAAVIDELSAVVARLRRKEDGLRWTAPESWHITLQFLGETTPEQYSILAAQLGEVRLPPVPVRLDGLGFFDRTGVFFAGVEVSGQMLNLQKSILAVTGGCGFKPETRPFHPHITLARAKGHNRGQGSRARGQSGLSELEAKARAHHNFTRFDAQEFNLYESFLGASGARYEIRQRYSLGRG